MPPSPSRSVVVWCPDWPVVAHQPPDQQPTAVFHANRVVAASPSARAAGVQRQMLRRQAQRRCPALKVLDRDLAIEARVFEQVVLTVEQFAPRLEILRPGVVAFPALGPSRYFGGDEVLSHRVLEAVDALLAGWGRSRVGVAEGPFAGGLAARHSDGTGVRLVPPGATPAFLAPLSITSLEVPELTSVLLRLGLRTLGQFAALPAADVAGRFGASGVWAHRLAAGVQQRPLSTSKPPADLEVVRNLETPLERIDQAAFLGKAMADELHDRMQRLGVACSQVVIVAQTEQGEILERCWRHEGALTASAIADRLRWQLDGWLHGSRGSRPTAGLSKLILRPNDTMAAKGRQLGFWGERTEATERVIRVVARLQGTLGPEQIKVPERNGGRSPHEQLVLVPAEAVNLERPSVDRVEPGDRKAADSLMPWPGKLPDPAPGRVHQPPLPAQLVDQNRLPVAVTGRGQLSGDPVALLVDDDWCDITAWAGPWPLDERWWVPEDHRRRARMQVVTADGMARLLSVEAATWQIEATYD